ncbi:MAG: hypothetical protein EOO63_01445 [Hymenobacter sp.]|nr:MAG: hypothetical protein EOO63_01445 [Hymenobacter sp.]
MAPIFSTPTEQSRQRLIKAAISFKEGITDVAEPGQRQVLTQFAMGRLTIDEVVYYLEATATSQDALVAK